MVCKVLDRLQEMDMYLKPSKCYFEVHKIEFLGMILENGTVTMDPVKVAGVAEWKEPKNVKDIRKFLGFCNFYRCFIWGFSQIAKPLNNLLKKGVKWVWEEAKQKAFDRLKKQVTEEPVLMQPDQKKQFEIEVDASNYAIGAVLMQKGEKDILHPVAFFLKTMNDAQRNYDMYNRELLALVETFRHWRHYLHSAAHKVKVHTDHANLLYWKNPGDHNRRVVQWHGGTWNSWTITSNWCIFLERRMDARTRYPDAQTMVWAKMTTSNLWCYCQSSLHVPMLESLAAKRQTPTAPDFWPLWA
jgi:hypothetical protein